jgi:Carbohydrate esterase, sialic acid-specific acetylesterase
VIDETEDLGRGHELFERNEKDAMSQLDKRNVKPFFRGAILPLVALLTVDLFAKDFAIADEVMRVFIFAGQSNMVGSDAHADRIDDYPEFRGAGVPQEDVPYSYILGNGDEASHEWKPLKPLSSFGPELTFARRVKQQVRGPIAIIKSAVGGTTVAFDWNPDAPEKGQKLYPRTLRLIRDSLQELENRGVHYRLEGVMWHQGENDMLDRRLYKQHAAGMTKLISQLRKDLQAPELKWYIAEVSEKGIWGMDHRSNLGVLHQQQQELLKADPLLRWVPTSHLAFEVMEVIKPNGTSLRGQNASRSELLRLSHS